MHTNIIRLLGNDQWCKEFPNVFIQVLERNIFHHSPLVMDFHDSMKINSPFRFLDVLTDHEELLHTIQ